MITKDEIITDPLGANLSLSEYFDKSDLSNELAYQVLADKWFNNIDVWDNYV